MDTHTRSRCEEMAKVMKALGHPTRTFIAIELSKGERCVCELTDMIGADMSTVSKHLNVMKEVGLVESEKRGLQMFYTLTSPCILSFFSCVENVVQRQIEKMNTVFKSEGE